MEFQVHRSVLRPTTYEEEERTTQAGFGSPRSPFLSLWASRNYRDCTELRNMSGRYRWVFIAERAAALASASPAPKPVPGHGDTHGYRTSAAVTSGCAATPRSTRGDRRSTKKNFVVMTLAAAYGSRFLFLTSLTAQSVSAALGLPLLPAAIGLAVSMPRLPLSPLSSLLAARRAAITCQRVLRPKGPPTTLQQTDATPRTASTSLPPRILFCGLILGTS